MARFLSYLIPVFLITSYLHLCNSEPITIAIGVISGILGIINFIWDKVDRINEVQGGSEPDSPLSIYNLKKQLDSMTAEIIKAVNDANRVQTFKDRLHEASEAINQIDDWYTEMVHYNQTFDKDNPNVRIVATAKKRVLNGAEGPRFYLRKIQKLFYYTSAENILQLLADIKKGYTGTCSTDTSLETVQQIYQKFYLWTSIAAGKTYLITEMAANIASINNTDSYSSTVAYTKESILEKDQEAIDLLKDYMKKASREVWRCDPDQQIEDVTYAVLHKLFQKYFIHEHDLGVQINDCTGSCKSLGNPAITGMCNPEDKNSVLYKYTDDGIFIRPGTVNDRESGSLCRNQRTCSGGLYDCDSFGIEYRFFSKNDYLDICHSDRNSNRRYDYAVKTYGKGGAVSDSWGHVENCKSFNSNTSPHLEQTKQCEVCMCTCAEDSSINPDEYISLAPVYTTEQNRVVTGAKLVKKYQTIRIEIEEGILGEAATVVNNSATWVTQEYKKPSKQDVDSRLYHKIRWNGGRAINLKDVNTPKGHAIIGLAFEYSDQYGLYLVIFSRPFNFITGELQKGNEKSLPSLSTVSKLNLENRDMPTLSTRKSSTTETNKSVEFTTTGLKEDIGQTVVPFWDIQDVTTTTHTAMSGAGLYYKTFDKYGGFLGLKLYTYDIEPHFEYKQESLD